MNCQKKSIILLHQTKSKDNNSNKKSKAQHTDAHGVIKEIIQNHLTNIVTYAIK